MTGDDCSQGLATLSEMADRLRVPRAWLRAEAEAGRLPHLRAGSRLLFDALEVERLVLARAKQGRKVPHASSRGAPEEAPRKVSAAGEQHDGGSLAHAGGKLHLLVLDAAGLARELRVGLSTFWKLDSAGHLPRGVRFGARCRRWPRAEIEAWLAAGAPHRDRWEASRPGGRR
jgi:predicted DNA-binding transcriptional regulator AlpA